MGPRRLLWLLLVMAVGLLVDSRGPAAWSDSLPDALAPVQRAAHAWDDTAAALGLDDAFDAVHNWVARLIEAAF